MYKLKEIAWNDLLGNYYSLHDQHEKAVTYFQRALKLNPQYTSAWTLMGHEFMERKNTSAAIEAYRKAIGKLLCKDEVSFASCNINNEFFWALSHARSGIILNLFQGGYVVG